MPAPTRIQTMFDGLRSDLVASRKLDANEGTFFARELEFISQRVREERFAMAKFRSILPMDPDQPDPGAESYTYYVETLVGQVKAGSAYDTEAPRIKTHRKGPFTSPIRPLIGAYGWSMQEIRTAARIGRPLTVKEALAARKVMELALNAVAWKGDATLKIPGFYATGSEAPGAVEVSTVNAKKTFADKIADGKPGAVYDDLMAWGNAVVEQSAGTIIPTTILLPLAQYNLISSTQMSTSTTDTILKRFLANSPYVKEVDWVPEAKTAGPLVGQGSVDVGACFARDPAVVSQVLPVDYEELAPEVRGFETLIHVHARTGGCKWEQTLGGKFFYGI